MPEAAAPRSHLARVLLAAALDISVIGGDIALRLAIEDATGSDLLVFLIPTAALICVTAWLAPKVSYRRRDAFWWLTGIGGLWLFPVIAWRLAYLPHRDWAPRDDELRRVRYLQDLRYVGTWLPADDRESAKA
ncbi:hypothetical protein [Actinoplanes sp. NPDC049118]|uniref:hypothetical protein n=1 Tax=Actinoplanes sp. NPDC049118 TaxID=3155769 RepID=UPI0033ED130C